MNILEFTAVIALPLWRQVFSARSPVWAAAFGVDIRYSIGASLVSVIATFSGASGRPPFYALIAFIVCSCCFLA